MGRARKRGRWASGRAAGARGEERVEGRAAGARGARASSRRAGQADAGRAAWAWLCTRCTLPIFDPF